MKEIYTRSDGSRGVRHHFPEPSLTKQAMRDECDINQIMKRFERTGVLTHMAQREAYFADVSVVPDFATAIRVVEDAERMFMSLPAQIRKEFDNDATRYVEFCADPSNLPRMRELGLAKPEDKPVSAPAPAPVVTP